MAVGTGVTLGAAKGASVGAGVTVVLRGKMLAHPQSRDAMRNAMNRIMLFFLLGRIPLAYQFWYGYNRDGRNFSTGGMNVKKSPERSSA